MTAMYALRTMIKRPSIIDILTKELLVSFETHVPTMLMIQLEYTSEKFVVTKDEY